MTIAASPRPRAISVNRGAAALVATLIARADALGVAVSTGAAGETLVDCGAAVDRQPGSRPPDDRDLPRRPRQRRHRTDAALPAYPFSLTVQTGNPVLACLGSQYAGWRLTSGEGDSAYFSIGSGPARALAGKEELFGDIGYADQGDSAVLVLETGQPAAGGPRPPHRRRRQVAPDHLTFLYAPTQSLAGTVQIIGRVVEVALHKAHVLHFDLSRIVYGLGSAPLAPPHPDFVTAMGRTNDAVIYGGRVLLHVTGPAAEAKALAEALPSRSSKDYGRPFAEIFRQYDGDFYKIDGSLFSPAEVAVVALETGETFRAGGIDASLVEASFG